MNRKNLIRTVSLVLAVVMLLGIFAGTVFATETEGSLRSYYSSAEFESAFTYEGDDLGATWTKDATTFRVWAPTADAVQVNLYESGTDLWASLIVQMVFFLPAKQKTLAQYLGWKDHLE